MPTEEHAPGANRQWKVTWPYGYPQAVDSAGSVAAPLLAGFSITLIAIAITSSQKLRWANQATIALAMATALLLFAVQAAFVASYYVTPADLTVWWPAPDDDPGLDALHDWQEQHKADYDKWAARFREAYNIGLVFLLAGVALCLVPPGTGRETGRWIAFGIIAAVVVFEFLWIGRGWCRLLRERD